jgi:drug/metabolite transporter (DMT)-like permease
MIAVIFYASYTVLLQKRPKIHPLSFVFATFLLGFPMIFPFYMIETFSGRPVILSSVTLLSFLYVAIFPSILSYLFYNRGVELIGANRAGLSSYLTPIFGTVLAIIFLGESFKWFHAVGIILISLGVFIATRIKIGTKQSKAPRYRP